MWTRRGFLRAGSASAFAAAFPGRAWGNVGAPRDVPPTALARDTPIRDPRVRALVLRALDVARQSGASYADVRVTMDATRTFGDVFYTESVMHGVGIRAFVEGYWGFASTPFISESEIIRIARDATALARGSSSKGKPRDASLAPLLPVRDGDWVTPATIDPMQVNIEEVLDWMGATNGVASRIVRKRFSAKYEWSLRPVLNVELKRTEIICASTDGAYTTQTFLATHIGEPALEIGIPRNQDTTGLMSRVGYTLTDQVSTGISPTAGWENALAYPLADMVERTLVSLERDVALPVKPVEVGRFDVVCDWATMGSLVSTTLGIATQLDRAIGDEANATGTSYLGPDPLTFLNAPIAAQAVTLTGERSTPGAAATVRWDSEGATPDAFPIVKNGILVEYQTTRESAAWLHARARRPGVARSRGCSGSPFDSALDIQVQQMPNFTLAPSAGNATFDSLVAGMARGIAIRDGRVVQTDRQAVTGYMTGSGVYQVRNGKIVGRVSNTGFLFKAPVLWKNVSAFGGAASARWSTAWSTKGEPQQYTQCSVCSPPAYVKDMTVVDAGKHQ